MRNPIQKFRQSSAVFEKPGFWSEKLKTLTSSNYHRVQYFWLKLCTHFLLTNVYKRVIGIFFIFVQIYFDQVLLRVICKNKKDLVSTHSFLQNKENPEHPFVDIVKQETRANFQQKVLNFVVVGARQSFQFFRQIAWFLGNNRALSKFRYRILYNLISITKL